MMVNPQVKSLQQLIRINEGAGGVEIAVSGTVACLVLVAKERGGARCWIGS